MKKLLLILPIAFVLASCGVNVTKATKVLENQGMSDVQITGYAWFGCSKNDWFGSYFTAKGMKGDRIEGVVCEGLFKGITVRFD